MTCSTCLRDFLAVFTCEDGKDRCYQCKSKYQPVPTRLPMVLAKHGPRTPRQEASIRNGRLGGAPRQSSSATPGFRETPGPAQGQPYASPYRAGATEPKPHTGNERRLIEGKRIYRANLVKQLEAKIAAVKTHMDWERNTRLATMVECYEECVRIVQVQARSD